MDEVTYEAVSAEVNSVADSLRGADKATVAAEMGRLEALAERIPDEGSRRTALIRVRKLPTLVEGPKAPTSPEFRRAAALQAQVLVDKGTPAERIAHAERVKREIGELSRQAPVRESMTILRLNSLLVRLIERLRDENPGT
ncbi:hypothetical protein ACXJJ3_30110 [Kribbella sp. WER1]